MEYAGQLRIPWTSGILVGIGETWEERIDSFIALKDLKFGIRAYTGNHCSELQPQGRNSDGEVSATGICGYAEGPLQFRGLYSEKT